MMKHLKNRMTLWALLSVVAFQAPIVQAEMVSSTIELDDIRHIHLLGPYSLVVTQGNEEYVTLTTDETKLAELEARIKGDVLALGSESDSVWNWFDSSVESAHFEVQLRDPRSVSSRGSGSVDVRALSTADHFQLSSQGSGEISAQSLAVGELELRIHGSGRSVIESIEAGDVSIRTYGSGDVTVGKLVAESVAVATLGSADVRVPDGKSEDLELSLNGSGDVDGSNLQAKRVNVTTRGSGDATVYVEEALDVSIRGSGDVRYRGQPAEVEQSVRGSGSLERL